MQTEPEQWAVELARDAVTEFIKDESGDPHAAARIEYLEKRLEIVPGLSETADGISCRDETIKLQDARIQALETERIGLLQANLEANTQLARVTLKKRNLETSLATVQRAAKTIMINEADELRQLRNERVKWHQAIATLDSERQANALLTDRVEALETSLAEAEGRVKALTIALHDAVRRPMGVVPESAEPFYLPSVADQVRLRLASDEVKK